MMRRSDKQPDRVEISPEQLSSAAIEAETLGDRLQRPIQVVGWYHSHPHITVWPSHVGKEDIYILYVSMGYGIYVYYGKIICKLLRCMCTYLYYGIVCINVLLYYV